MGKVLKITNSLFIVFGILTPIVWHIYYLGLPWVHSRENSHHGLGTVLGAIYGYSISILILVLCGGLVYILSNVGMKNSHHTTLLRWQKYIGATMAIVPLLTWLMIVFFLLLF